MQYASGALVGREQEHAQIASAVERAVSGEGALVLVAGEAGIGKSRLIEAASDGAVARGVRGVWGRCLEAGGAPPFWPWVQVFRALLREGALQSLTPARKRALWHVLPEIIDVESANPPASSADPERARFGLLDGACAALLDVAAHGPRLVVLEDIHFADASSLALLEVLAAQLRTSPLVVIGTLRVSDASASGQALQLQRLIREARIIELGPLSREAVRAFVQLTVGDDGAEPLCDTLYDVTEGHPLFLTEMTRLVAGASPARRGADTRSSHPPLELPRLPTTIASVLRERLRLLSPDTSTLLAAASVLGREFTLAALSHVAERSVQECAAFLDPALDAAIVQTRALEGYRFGHILFREVLYQELGAGERERLHRRAAEYLERAGATDGAELLHHLLRGGGAVAARAVEVGTRFVQSALEQLAFAEAVDTCEQMQSTLDQFLAEDDARRFSVLLLLGRARLAAGMVSEGRQACTAAARIAARLGDPQRFAEAALAYGSLMVLGEVDRDMVRLLHEALSLLPDSDSGLRARLMARLANAIQPSPNPEQGFELARNAIAMARRLGDEQALFEALREGIGALMDLASPHERRSLNEEYHELAKRRGDLPEQFRARTRALFDYFELGQMPLVREQVRHLAFLAAQLKHPYYEWQATSYAVAEYIFSGRLTEAERLLERARDLSARARDPNTGRVLAALELFLAHAYGEDARVLEALRGVEREFGDNPYGRLMVVAEYCEQRHPRAKKLTLDPSVVELLLASGDLSALHDLARIAEARSDREFAARLYPLVAPHRERWVSGGQTTRLLLPLAEHTLARLAMTLGDHALALDHYARAYDAVQRAGAEPYQLSVGIRRVACLALFGRTSEREQLLDELTRLAADRGWQGWLARLDALFETLPSAEPGAPSVRRELGVSTKPMSFRMELSGDVWTFVCVDRSFQLKDNKGLRLLQRLVSEPGREFHVLDLSGAGADVDTGGGLEALDDEARRQYAAHIRELERELDEAEANNDLGRSEALRAELGEVERALAQAFGLGGRKRPVAAAAERARVNIQRRLRDAIARIEKQHEALGRYLRWTIKTGSYCRYDPD